ncbi:MAG: hypothetical protein AAF224_02375 [Pseudomonadota bacterium]
MPQIFYYAIIVLLVCGGLGSSAAAGVVTFHGTISSIEAQRINIANGDISPLGIFNPANEPFDVGDDFSIQFNLNDASNQRVGGGLTRYDIPFSASFGDYTITDALAVVGIDNDRVSSTPSSSGDILFFSASASGPRGATTSDALVAGLPFNNIQSVFRDPSASAFSDELLTSDKFDFSLFSANGGSLVFSNRPSSNIIDALTVRLDLNDISYVEISEVPLPAAFPLFFLGLAGIGSVKKFSGAMITQVRRTAAMN